MRLEVEQSGGRLISVTGDGTFSLFDGPTDAVRCADEIRKAAQELGISVRAGVHTGELERTGGDFTGLSVHVGAPVSAMAMPNEVLVSRAVYDLVAGSGLAFVERGEHTLKGVPGSWHLYALAGADRLRCCRRRGRSTPLDRIVLSTARTAPRAMRAVLRLGNALSESRPTGPVASRLLSHRLGLLRLASNWAGPGCARLGQSQIASLFRGQIAGRRAL